MATNFEIANHNLMAWANAQAQLNSGNPAMVTIPMMDANGNIVNIDVPNRGKFQKAVWDDVGGALGQFSRTFYIDPQNGNDTNDGSESNPFKTIKKAIDIIPNGGVVDIHLKDGTHLIDADIVPVNKTISFHGSENAIITHTINSNKYTYGIKGKKTNIVFYNCKLKTYSGELNSNGYVQCLIGRANSSGNMFVALYSTKIEINDAHLFQQSLGGGKLDLHINASGKALGQGKLLDIESGKGVATLGINSWSVTDGNNNNVSVLNMVTGIVRDADSGNPINFLSNINFSS